MRRLALVFVAATIVLAGCKNSSGSASPTPTATPTATSIPTVAIKALRNGQPLTSATITESSDYNFTTLTPIGPLATATTDATGTATFTGVIAGNRYCFSYSVGAGAANNAAVCQAIAASTITIGS